MRNLNSYKTKKSNSLLEWYNFKNPLIVVFNFIVISLSKITPSLSLKRGLLRLTGMKIGKNASIGLGAMFDVFFPELIKIGENTIIGYNTTILAHEFLINELRTGKVKIGNNVMIGANSTVLAGIEICDNVTVSACSLVNKSITKKGMYGGVPAKKIK
jgi:acetyltransferase-like isoleucine patch superfamily enzyme